MDSNATSSTLSGSGSVAHFFYHNNGSGTPLARGTFFRSLQERSSKHVPGARFDIESKGYRKKTFLILANISPSTPNLALHPSYSSINRVLSPQSLTPTHQFINPEFPSFCLLVGDHLPTASLSMGFIPYLCLRNETIKFMFGVFGEMGLNCSMWGTLGFGGGHLMITNHNYHSRSLLLLVWHSGTSVRI